MDVKARASFAKRMREERLTMITVCLDEPGHEALPSISDRTGLSWACMRIQDQNDPILKAFYIREFPTTVVVDSAGIVQNGFSSWDDLAVIVRAELLMAEWKERRK